MCVQGVQYGTEDATLGGSCVQGEGSGGVFAHPDDLGLVVRKSRIQVFRPSSISLPASLLGTMELKADVKSMNNILI